jgi:hypothetical protein
MTGNRRDLMVVRGGVTAEQVRQIRYVLAENSSLQGGVMLYWIDRLKAGEFGVVHSDAQVTLLERGASTERNEAALLRLTQGGLVKESPPKKSVVGDERVKTGAAIE